MRILVTGGAGFFGVNLVRSLAATDSVDEVICADLTLPDGLSQRYLSPVADRVRAVQLDVTDRAAFVRLVRTCAVTHLVHAAAVTPDEATEQARPEMVVDVNLGGSTNALAALASCPGLKRVLLVSSSGVYGTRPAGGSASHQHEEDPVDPHSLYAVTKYSMELLGRRYQNITGKPVAAVRLGPLYGPLERPGPTRTRTTVVQHLAAALRTGPGRPLRVAGPEIVRDWTYVGDAAEAVRALLVAPPWRYAVYNVSYGHGYAFHDVVNAFVARGLQVAWVAPEQMPDVVMLPEHERRPLDITRLRTESGFSPRYDLDRGIGEYLESQV